jgi:hypothetical protein
MALIISNTTRLYFGRVESKSWLSCFRRLRIRDERRTDIHLAFLQLGCALICLRCWLNRF